jgi:hypothetical protein
LTEVNNMATARFNNASAGTASSALAAGGSTDPGGTRTTATEEWNAPPISIKTFTTS